MANKKPARNTSGKRKTEVLRAPDDISEMIDTIAQHELNGWKTAAAVLDDPGCPLRDWLIPLYQRVIAEKMKRAAEIKRTSEN